MPSHSSDSGGYSCGSEDAIYVDYCETEAQVKDVKDDLQRILEELQGKMQAPLNETERACLMGSVMVKLQSIDVHVRSIMDVVMGEPPPDDLVSTFGMTLKLGGVQKKLKEAKTKHEQLKKEWYSQEKHLAKISVQLEKKEKEVVEQTVYASTQGATFGRMLWKASNIDHILDKMVMHDKHVLELMQNLNACLYSFHRTLKCGNQPLPEEYQYMMCLCGLLSNLASVPDGRFLLANQPVGRSVFDHIIRILPKLTCPKASDIKWLMLVALYNFMVCKEGNTYAKTNGYLMKSLSSCIDPPNPSKVVELALKMMVPLTDVSSKKQVEQVCSGLPSERLEQLQNCKDSAIRKQARKVTSGIRETKQRFSEIERVEKLLHKTALGDDLCDCANEGTQTKLKVNRNVIAYYVLQDTPKSDNSASSSSSSSMTNVVISAETATKPTSTSLVKLKDTQVSSCHSFSAIPGPSTTKKSYFGESSLMVPSAMHTSFITKYKGKDDEKELVLDSCHPSHFSLPLQRRVPSEEQEDVVSEDVHTSQLGQHLDLTRLFMNIGDHIGNRNASTSFLDRGSIITFFRIGNSAQLLSSNSYVPFAATISTNTSWNIVDMQSKQEVATMMEVATQDRGFDALGGFAKIFISPPQDKGEQCGSFDLAVFNELPSTSTGEYHDCGLCVVKELSDKEVEACEENSQQNKQQAAERNTKNTETTPQRKPCPCVQTCIRGKAKNKNESAICNNGAVRKRKR